VRYRWAPPRVVSHNSSPATLLTAPRRAHKNGMKKTRPPGKKHVRFWLSAKSPAGQEVEASGCRRLRRRPRRRRRFLLFTWCAMPAERGLPIKIVQSSDLYTDLYVYVMALCDCGLGKRVGPLSCFIITACMRCEFARLIKLLCGCTRRQVFLRRGCALLCVLCTAFGQLQTRSITQSPLEIDLLLF
jgi:hypothetical protein